MHSHKRLLVFFLLIHLIGCCL